MGEFLVYILKFAACLTVFFVFYMLLLSRETFHRSNRLMLLAIMVLSAVVPLIKWTAQASEPLYIIAAGTWDLTDILTDELPEEVRAGGAASAWIIVAYIVGTALFLVHNIIAVLKIRGIIRSGIKRKSCNGMTLILTQWPVPPFSWFNNVVIHPADLEENGEAIIAHERAHVELRHSLDMALATVCVALQWFNPAAWLLMRELRNVHEYEADEQVLKQGIDAKTYQLLLISKAVGRERFVAVASSFRNNKIKKRITMMLKNRSNVVARLKYACILPLSVLAVAVFARPEVAASLEVISNVSVKEFFVPAADTIVTVAPQTSEIAAEAKSNVNMESNFSISNDIEVEVDDVKVLIDSIRENVRIVQIDDTVIVSVNNSIDTTIISVNDDVEKIKKEAIELRRRAAREGVRAGREFEKWKEEHADEIEEVKKRAEAVAKKAAEEGRKAFKEADKIRQEFVKEWKEEREKQIKADTLRGKRERRDSLRTAFDKRIEGFDIRRAEFETKRDEWEKRREKADSLRASFETQRGEWEKRRDEFNTRRDEFRTKRDEADRRRKEADKEGNNAEPESVVNKTGLRET